MKKISLIVPCYNEETCLPAFDREISKVVEGRFEKEGKGRQDLVWGRQESPRRP